MNAVTERLAASTHRTAAPRRRLLPAVILAALAAQCDDVLANEAAVSAVAVVQFDSEFLVTGGARGMDISRFEQGSVVLPGEYRVDVHVNQGLVGRIGVAFHAEQGMADAQPCFDEALLRRLGVDMEQLQADVRAQLATAGSCLRIGQAVADADAVFDFGAQRLDLSVPQAALVRRARGYVDPASLDPGINAGMLGYSLNVYRHTLRGQDAAVQGYLGLNAGVNLGAWRFRHDGSYSFDTRGRRDYQAVASYAKREIPRLSAELTVGEAFTSGELFDSTAFHGVRLQTDERMLPDSLRGYAPTVRGVANSNARVTIRQGGALIHESVVAPGAFTIDDLYATGYGGDLEVTILEADGSRRSFSVPFAAVPLSLRPGARRFSAVVGELRDAQLSDAPMFMQASWQQGLSNRVTGYAGVTRAPDYLAGVAGVALNTRLGAVGMDITHSSTFLSSTGSVRGASYRLNYARDLPASGTNISIAAYRYSTAGYYGLNEAMQAREQARQWQWLPGGVQQARNRASLTLGQRLGQRGGRLYATASLSDYWHRPDSDLNYALGYSGSRGALSYSVSANRQNIANGQAETQYNASLTIPLGGTRLRTLSSTVGYRDNGQSRVQNTLTGALGERGRLAYGVSLSHAQGGGSGSDAGLAANATYRAGRADFQASVSGGDGYVQASAGMRGAVLLHAGGWTLSQPVSETFAIVEVADAHGARVLNAADVRIDRRGYAVVPHLTPYRANTVGIDPKGLSTDVALQVSSQQVTPRVGAVAMVRFATESGRSAVLEVRHPDGTAVPFGANVIDEDDNEVGVVGQGGRIFVRGIKDQGRLTVRWSDDARDLCQVDYVLPVRGGQAAVPQMVDGQCRAGAGQAAAVPAAEPGMRAGAAE